MARLYDICALRSGIDNLDEIKALIELKKKKLEELMTDCRTKEYINSAAYLENARNDLFTGLSIRLEGNVSSRVGYLFPTVNTRVNVSKWTTRGALNVTKVRLSYYYNGFYLEKPDLERAS